MSKFKRVKKYKSDEKVTRKPFKTSYLSIAFYIRNFGFTVYPFFNAVAISFKEDYKVISDTFSGWGLGNYQKIFLI